MAEPLEGIRYTVEWKALLKTNRIEMGTEQDIDLAPEALWETTLHKKVREQPQERPEPGDTVVVLVSVQEVT